MFSRTSIRSLLFPRCPFAVLGEIAFFIVFSLKSIKRFFAKSSGRARSHVFNKILESFWSCPSFAYAYSSTTITMIRRMFFAPTAFMHRGPYSPFLRCAPAEPLTMRYFFALMPVFNSQATARFCRASADSVASGHNLIPAYTATFPQSLTTAIRIGITKYKQTVELEPFHVESLHGRYNITICKIY